jgi:hypothetical protein
LNEVKDSKIERKTERSAPFRAELLQCWLAATFVEEKCEEKSVETVASLTAGFLLLQLEQKKETRACWIGPALLEERWANAERKVEETAPANAPVSLYKVGRWTG